MGRVHPVMSIANNARMRWGAVLVTMVTMCREGIVWSVTPPVRPVLRRVTVLRVRVGTTCWGNHVSPVVIAVTLLIAIITESALRSQVVLPHHRNR